MGKRLGTAVPKRPVAAPRGAVIIRACRASDEVVRRQQGTVQIQERQGVVLPPCHNRIATAVGHCQIPERDGAMYPDDVGAVLEIGARAGDNR